MIRNAVRALFRLWISDLVQSVLAMSEFGTSVANSLCCRGGTVPMLRPCYLGENVDRRWRRQSTKNIWTVFAVLADYPPSIAVYIVQPTPLETK